MAEVFDKSEVGRLIAKGAHYEIKEYSEDKVIKIPLPRSVRHTISLQAKEHYLLLKSYLGDFLPRTRFVQSKEYQQPLVIQEKIKGRTLREIDWNEIGKSKVLSKNLFELISGVIKLEEETGKIAEVFGKGSFWWKVRPKDTDNIVVDKKGKPYLVDVFLLDPKEIKVKWWQLRRKWLFWMLKRNLRRMKKDLKSLF